MTVPQGNLDLSNRRSLAQRSPRLEPYNPARQREATRALIAGGLITILALTIGGIFYLVAIDKLEATTLTQTVLPALVGLVGTALGFYFGGESRST